MATQPKAEKRALRSIFKPKSARILRTMLRVPSRAWRVVELAEAAGVSVGHASTIGKELKERGWGEQSEGGLVLADPSSLLDAWADEYELPAGREQALYTHFHGQGLEDALASVPGNRRSGHLLLRSYSAAERIAPFARNANSISMPMKRRSISS